MTSPRERAADLDRTDPLGDFRDLFVIDDELIYLDGNSLGRPPHAAAEAVANTLAEGWATELVMGWDHWLDMGAETGDVLAPLIGASPGEVVLGDQTSVNLYKLAMAALAAANGKSIMTDAGNFPSDLYILDSVARQHGGELVVIDEDPSPSTLANHLDDSIGLVALTHVSYRSGAMHDGVEVTRVVHAAGALMLWDLAHSVGAVPVDLDGWGADLAVGCTYKYLNGGPGAPGFLFVAAALQSELHQPITGWFGHEDQFSFATEFVPSDSIRRFLVGTPPILSLAAARAAIDISAKAGIAELRRKGTSLTGLFLEAVGEWAASFDMDIVTPLDPHHRGSHISLRHEAGFQISKALRAQGVIVDFRSPDLVRFGFAPLYTTHAEVVAAAEALHMTLREQSWQEYPSLRSGVT
ncbi:MAG: kynureninase [Acidimicrobiia bacterium]